MIWDMAYFFHFLAVVAVLDISKILKKNFFLVNLNSFPFPCSVRPALVDTDLHVHSASAQGKVSGGRDGGGSFYFVH